MLNLFFSNPILRNIIPHKLKFQNENNLKAGKILILE